MVRSNEKPCLELGSENGQFYCVKVLLYFGFSEYLDILHGFYLDICINSNCKEHGFARPPVLVSPPPHPSTLCNSLRQERQLKTLHQFWLLPVC